MQQKAKKKILFTGIILISLLINSCSKNNSEENITSQLEDSNDIDISEAETFPSYWAMENLRLREEPKTDSREISTIQQRAVVQILDTGEQATINNIIGNWVFVQLETGDQGWCFGGYLTDNRETAIIIGTWHEESLQIPYAIYRFSVDETYILGFEGTGARISGTWSIRENDMHMTRSTYDFMEERFVEIDPRDVSFSIVNENTLRLDDTNFARR